MSMFETLFFLHDTASDFLAKYLFTVKRSILAIAHLSLFVFLFPEFHKSMGQLAFTLLLGLLFLSPLSKIFRVRLLFQLMALRREMGILMAYVATVHGLGYALNPLWFSVYIAPHWWMNILSIEPRFLFGLVAYGLTLPLLLTSNTVAQQILGGQNWKNVHRLVYGVFIFAVLHRFLLRGSGGEYKIEDFLQALFMIAAYVLVKVLAWKNFFPPLVRLIERVAGRYQIYTAERKARLSL